MIKHLVVITALCLVAFDVSADDSIRCGSKLVRVGMTMDVVLKYCGQPTSKEVEEHDIRSGNRVVGKTKLHRWTYEHGTGGSPKILEFDQDKLISIK